MLTQSDHTCSTCVFWHRRGPQLAHAERDPSCSDDVGTCNMLPPVVAAIAPFPVGIWPRTHAGRWCGGWEAAGAVDGPDDGERAEGVVTPFRRAEAA